jgi:2,5-dioxopentanoate dehydrogenase
MTTRKIDDTPVEAIDEILQKAWHAFQQYRKLPLTTRAAFMRAIAEALNENASDLVASAMAETNLPEGRLKGELNRTIFQLRSYGEACERGAWLDARIDRAQPDKAVPSPDIRKMLVPLGPVVVFGASNFPFAYSTAGGDTACAFAAGCPVVVKGHPAHIQTSQRVADIIQAAAKKTSMPEGIFTHVSGASFETGKALVMHPRTKAVGFTGSLGGGKQLFDWGNQRKEPIPVFAEMGSINPILLLPEKLSSDTPGIAKTCAASITLSVGQFCTNPGLIIGLQSPALDEFKEALKREVNGVLAGKMLHPGIAKAYVEKRSAALAQDGVSVVATGAQNEDQNDMSGVTTIASTTGAHFLSNEILHQEVFGPYSIIIACADETEMLSVIQHLEGQLTATMIATENDIRQHASLVEAVKDMCGRFILNGVPTGVEVCLSMHHGGPYPATTDSRFTAVGADGIRRFARPMCFQNWPDTLLPAELQNGNPLKIWRTVDNELTNGQIE